MRERESERVSDRNRHDSFFSESQRRLIYRSHSLQRTASHPLMRTYASASNCPLSCQKVCVTSLTFLFSVLSTIAPRALAPSLSLAISHTLCLFPTHARILPRTHERTHAPTHSTPHITLSDPKKTPKKLKLEPIRLFTFPLAPVQ
jgi:hypothetical protein